MPKNVKWGGPLGFFASVAKYQKLKRVFGDYKKFSKKRRILNSPIVPKHAYVTLWDFKIPFCCKISRKPKVGPIRDIKKLRGKNFHKAKKGGRSHSKKLEIATFCFRMVLYFKSEALDAFKIKC